MKELSKLQLCVYNIGGLLLVAGIIVPLFSGATAVALYLYLLGALMFSSMQVLQKYTASPLYAKGNGKWHWQSEPFWRSTLHLEYRLNWHAKNGETLTYKSD